MSEAKGEVLEGVLLRIGGDRGRHFVVMHTDERGSDLTAVLDEYRHMRVRITIDVEPGGGGA